MVRFVHTADWQLGKPYGRITSPEMRERARQARIESIGRIGDVVRAHGAGFVVVAGDLFDSPQSDPFTIHAACQAIGRLGVPVYAIPGNHDHGGAGTVWESRTFAEARARYAPLFRVLLAPEPVEIDGARLYPCPLFRRQTDDDATDWVTRHVHADDTTPRIVIAHGSVRDFTGNQDDGDDRTGQPNRLHVDRLIAADVDYVALGDWHGTLKIDERVWYAGTHEPDRFPKADPYDPGNVLVVELESHGAPLQVTRVHTGALRWHVLDETLPDEEAVAWLGARMQTILGDRLYADLIDLTVRGTLGYDTTHLVRAELSSLADRVVRLKLDDRIVVAPTQAEMQSLTDVIGDPLLSMVARKLDEEISAGGDGAALAQSSMYELFSVVQQLSAD